MDEEPADPNIQNNLNFAYVDKNTGLASGPPGNSSDSDIQTYGPYYSAATAYMVYEMSLLLHRNRRFECGLRPLARCLMTFMQSQTADGPPVDPLLYLAYGGCLIDALAVCIVTSPLNFNDFQPFWNNMQATFLTAARRLQNDFDEHRHQHLQLLNSLRGDIFRAYQDNSWPDDVWPEFRSCVREENPQPSGLPPKCFQVLIGEKAIKEQEDVALPDKLMVDFRTKYARDLCESMEAQLGKLRVPGLHNAELPFIKMLDFVLSRNFDSNRETQIKPSHRPSLFSRYAGHIADALIDCIPKNGGFMIQQKTYPEVLDYSSDDYFDGLYDSPRRVAMAQAFEEIVAAYNRRQWSVDVWRSLLEEINNSNPSLTPNPSFASNPNLAPISANPNVPSNPCPPDLVKMYEASCGAERNWPADAQLLLPQIEPWTSEEGVEGSADGQIEIKDDEVVETLDECFQIQEDYKCSGPTSVTYTLRWVCKSDHTAEGWREEKFGPFSVKTGDCAYRIHDEVKKIFRFATEFPSVRCDPEFVAPPFVVGSCVHYKDPQVVPMEYRNGDWYPSV